MASVRQRAVARVERLSAEDGFTLSELLTVLSILTIVIGTLMAVFVSGMNAQQRVQRRFDTQQEARLALDQIRREAHCASALTIGGGGSTLSMTLPPQCPTSGATIATVTYTATPVAASRYRLERTMGASTRTVADYLLQSNAFTYAAPGATSLGRLTVDLQVNVKPDEPPGDWQLTSDIALRNTQRI